MRPMKFSPFIFLPIWFFLLAQPAFAISKINITVKTILASQGPEFIDPQLKTLVNELRSVFRYTSYRLLGQNQIQLAIKKTGTVSLPGNRILKITAIQIKGNRSKLRLAIIKEKQQIFQTTIQLLNHGSITLGGPKHKKGFLLFNISNFF